MVRQVGPGPVHGPFQFGLLLNVQFAMLLDGEGDVVDLIRGNSVREWGP